MNVSELTNNHTRLSRYPSVLLPHGERTPTGLTIRIPAQQSNIAQHPTLTPSGSQTNSVATPATSRQEQKVTERSVQ